ncbi:MAG: choice-of-anchor J domain-containing protein [Cyclobacteriaceae bacterium]
MGLPDSIYRPFGLFTGLFIFLNLALISGLQAQHEQCGTVPFNDRHLIKKGLSSEEQKTRFEEWLSRKKEQQPSTFRLGQDEPVYTIPVVVHIIHRGEPVGEGTNIPVEQVLDQIRILNEDFRRLNPDRENTLPIFEPVAADSRIEFALARQSPEGFPTDGITRTEGERLSYGINSAQELSNLSYWPAEEYFNIWVAPLGNGLLGYAQFPVSNLPGIEGSPNNRETDGVVIDFRYFGSTGSAISTSTGRTTTHEVGHFLGLRHIWGDGDCSADDFVEDTPLQESDSDGCPVDPFSCGSPDMFQNYMDYTTDVCMNLFTQQQAERMRIVLTNSPRRASLLVSPALIDPSMVENDANIRQIVSPQASECDGNFVPQLSVINSGTNAIESINVRLLLQGSVVQQQEFNVSLAPRESTVLDFAMLQLGEGNNQPLDIAFEIARVNGQEDGNPLNNERAITFIIPQRGTLPLNENFEAGNSESLLNDGVVRNPDGLFTWAPVAAPGFAGQNNQAIYINFYDYENGIGEEDFLYTPTYDLSGLAKATLSFRYAYAPFIESGELSQDGLRVGISTDCGATIEEVLFDASGSELATQAPSSSPFAPQSRAAWRQLSFSLDDYIGQENVQIIFIGYNDWGNNLYLDDIQISIEEAVPLDIAVEEVLSPARLSCNEAIIPVVRVRNEGQNTINTFEVTYQIDGGAETNFVDRSFPLPPGESRLLSFEAFALDPGLHELTVRLSKPNLLEDDIPQNNFLSYQFFVDEQEDVIPLIKNFDTSPSLADVLSGQLPGSADEWVVVNPDGETSWTTEQTEGLGFNNTSAFINLYDYQEIGAVDQLVSPRLDLRGAEEASVFFKVSYALLSDSYADTLRLLVSDDCGLTYETVYERAGADLAILESTESWAPQTESDWREEFVNLSDYIGMSDIRVAFEVVNAYGNNLYLDDIEFFVSATDEPAARILDENSFRVFPNPYDPSSAMNSDGYLKIAFNLLDRQNVQILLLDTKGRTVGDELFPFTLNQTYTFDFSSLPSGMYIIRVLGNTLNATQQIIKR